MGKKHRLLRLARHEINGQALASDTKHKLATNCQVARMFRGVYENYIFSSVYHFIELK